MPEWYSIDTVTKWGDYWTILIAGMTAHLPRLGERLQLERTGPYVPPMVVSGLEDLVVTESMKALLATVPGVTGFRPVVKTRIVLLDWSKWELSGEIHELYQFREPEDTVLSLDHDPALAHDIGELYEVLLETDGRIRLDYDDDGLPKDSFWRAPVRQLDLFKATTSGGSGVAIGSNRLISRLPEECLSWLELNPVGVAESTDDEDEELDSF